MMLVSVRFYNFFGVSKGKKQRKIRLVMVELEVNGIKMN